MSDLRKLAEAATPGEWRTFDAVGGVSIWADGPGASGDDDLEIAHMAEERPRANAAYIAAANPRWTPPAASTPSTAPPVTRASPASTARPGTTSIGG